MIRIIALAIAVLGLITSLTGCQVLELNESAIATGIGVNYENNNIVASVQLAQPAQPSGGSSSEGRKFIVVSENGSNMNEALYKINLSFPRKLLLSQSNVVILGEELARKDLSLFADVGFRNPDIRKNSMVFIARDALPEEILGTEVPLEPNSALAIPRIMTTQEKMLGLYSPVTLEDFFYALSNPGIEAVVPQLRIDNGLNGRLVTIDGTAVFKGRKMVGSLNPRESKGLRWLKPGMVAGGFETLYHPLDTDSVIAMEITRSQAKIKPQINNGQVTVQINIKAEGNFYEQVNSGDLLNLKNIPLLEELTSQEIKKDILACVNKAQRLNSDILGWGNMLEDKAPGLWQGLKNNWDQAFPNIKADVKVDYQMRRTYLTTESFHFE